MDLEKEFLEAALPAPVVLLGQRLEPYSIGHELMLKRHESPFLGGEAKDVEEHLFLAIWICCQRWEEYDRALRAGTFFKDVQKWRRKVGKLNVELVAAKMRVFMKYVEAGSRQPEVQVKQRYRSPTPLGAPNLAVLIATLLGRLHFGSYSEVMDCPLGLGRWLYATWWERESALVIRQTSEDEELAAVKAAAAARGLELIKMQSA